MSLALHEALSDREYRKKPELARLMGCTERDVEHAIERARKTSRLPVMSGPTGYRLARDADEYAYNVDNRRRRAIRQLLTVRGEIALLRKWRGEPPPPPPPVRVKKQDAAPEPLWGAP